jgi:hypothetical protein
LLFQAADESQLQRYRFGLGAADFLICRQCGVYLGAVYAGADRRVGILNLRALTPVPTGLPAAVAMNYDGEAQSERTACWAVRWTPLLYGSL